MAGLGDPVALLLKPTKCVELHDFWCRFKDSEEKKEAADYGASATLTVVAVEHSDPVRVLFQELGHFIADEEESIERRSFVVFPVVADDILQFFLFNVPSADVDGDVFVLVSVLKKLSDGVN